MKKLDTSKFSAEELNKELFALTKQKLNLRIQLSTQQSTNYAQLKMIRKDIARILTRLKSRSLL